jgi:glutamine amidotransferase
MGTQKVKIAIIDYGMGNLRSVEKAFHKIGAEGAFVTDDPRAVADADKAVLPGDGAFDSTMNSLRRSGVDRIALDFIRSGRPFLGICVGMQVLLTHSDEGESGIEGLNVIPGRVRKFPAHDSLKVPQIGWNDVCFRPDAPLGEGLPAHPMAYFLHSFYCVPDDPANTAATTDYGLSYASALHRDNVWATQFHPEKSGPIGLTILRNFSRP